MKPDEQDEKADKEEPKEEIEQLEHENEVRADHLGGNEHKLLFYFSRSGANNFHQVIMPSLMT